MSGREFEALFMGLTFLLPKGRSFHLWMATKILIKSVRVTANISHLAQCKILKCILISPILENKIF